jgi:hypothetical protein
MNNRRAKERGLKSTEYISQWILQDTPFESIKKLSNYEGIANFTKKNGT